MNNSNQRLQNVFFYGLYMDEVILKSKNVIARDKRISVANGYELRIGNMATLFRKDNAKAYGITYSLTHDEIDILYKKSGLTQYVSESIVVELEDGSSIPTLCCILLNPPKADEKNDEYFQKLIKCMSSYKLQIPQNV